jgi:dienelactone hydrolase
VTVDDLRASLARPPPPSGCPATVVALWHDAKGDWEAAHRIAPDIDDAGGAWVHAYLHRKEGDAGNAAYWYRRAGQPIAHDPPDQEWARIVTALLAG